VLENIWDCLIDGLFRQFGSFVLVQHTYDDLTNDSLILVLQQCERSLKPQKSRALLLQNIEQLSIGFPKDKFLEFKGCHL